MGDPSVRVASEMIGVAPAWLLGGERGRAWPRRSAWLERRKKAGTQPEERAEEAASGAPDQHGTRAAKDAKQTPTMESSGATDNDAERPSLGERTGSGLP